jgi:hypothetical protein
VSRSAATLICPAAASQLPPSRTGRTDHGSAWRAHGIRFVQPVHACVVRVPGLWWDRTMAPHSGRLRLSVRDCRRNAPSRRGKGAAPISFRLGKRRGTDAIAQTISAKVVCCAQLRRICGAKGPAELPIEHVGSTPIGFAV